MSLGGTFYDDVADDLFSKDIRYRMMKVKKNKRTTHDKLSIVEKAAAAS